MLKSNFTKLTALFGILFMLTALIACGGGGGGGDVGGSITNTTINSGTSYGTITGTVTDEGIQSSPSINSNALRAPVAGCTVQIQGSNISTTTDKDGVFLIESVTPGSYSLYAYKDVNNKKIAFWKDNVSVSPGVITTLGNLSLKTTGIVKGTISSNSQPVSGVTIKIMGQTDTTDTNGNYQVSNIPYGSYLIEASKTGFNNYSATISIGDVTKTHDISIASSGYTPKMTISGYVYYAGTTIPVAGVVVSIANNTFTTSSDGAYSLQNITPGNYTLTAKKEGYDDYSASLEISAKNITKDIFVTSASYTHTLTGLVTDANDKPISGIAVTVLNADNKPSNLNDTTDANGHYQIASVPQGSRTVKFTGNNYFDDKIVTVFMANIDKSFDAKLTAKKIGSPTNFSGNSNTFNKVTLSWKSQNNSALFGFNIYMSSNQNDGYKKINSEIISSSVSSYDYSTVYDSYYKISSVNVDGVEGALSTYVFVTAQKTLQISTASELSGIVRSGNILWCSDSYTRKIYKIQLPAGNTVATFNYSTGIYGLAWDGQYLWATQGGASQNILKINPSTGVIEQTISPFANDLIFNDKDYKGFETKLLTSDGTFLYCGVSFYGFRSGTYQVNYRIYLIDPTGIQQTYCSNELYDKISPEGVFCKDGFIWVTGYFTQVGNPKLAQLRQNLYFENCKDKTSWYKGAFYDNTEGSYLWYTSGPSIGKIPFPW